MDVKEKLLKLPTFTTRYMKLKMFMKSIIRGFINIKKWFFIIFRDNDFDENLIFSILYKKLELLEKNAEKNNDKNLKNIKILKNICMRLKDDIYLENATKEHDKRYHFRLEDLFDDMLNGFKKLRIDNTGYDESLNKCMKHADKLKDQDLQMFIHYLKKYIKKN